MSDSVASGLKDNRRLVSFTIESPEAFLEYLRNQYDSEVDGWLHLCKQTDWKYMFLVREKEIREINKDIRNLQGRLDMPCGDDLKSFQHETLEQMPSSSSSLSYPTTRASASSPQTVASRVHRFPRVASLEASARISAMYASDSNTDVEVEVPVARTERSTPSTCRYMLRSMRR